MKPVVFLASLSALGLAAALPTNETRTWFISGLDIRHQTGLPSSVQFSVTDGPEGTVEPIFCSQLNDDPFIINSTLIPDVDIAVCDDPTWAFAYVSIPPGKDEDDDPTVPLAGKLLIGQNVTETMAMSMKPSNHTGQRMFVGSLTLQGHDFELWERYIDYSALLYYGGPESFTVVATEALNSTFI